MFGMKLMFILRLLFLVFKALLEAQPPKNGSLGDPEE